MFRAEEYRGADLRPWRLGDARRDTATVTTDRFGMTVLETNECWELLRGADVGRLAVAIANAPDIFPVNFVVDHGSIVFRTAEGTKLAASVLGRSVAFEIDGYDAAAGDAWSVVVKGEAVEIDRMQDVFDALDLPLFPWHAGPKHRFVRIEPAEVSGRRFHVVEDDEWGGPHRGRPRAAPE
jgi:nitroimidazol reductase NimA-like FMN-containing flavoprotein (pyridoxamine 5'-phosphate oxidase superfamily)